MVFLSIVSINGTTKSRNTQCADYSELFVPKVGICTNSLPHLHYTINKKKSI